MDSAGGRVPELMSWGLTTLQAPPLGTRDRTQVNIAEVKRCDLASFLTLSYCWVVSGLEQLAIVSGKAGAAWQGAAGVRVRHGAWEQAGGTWNFP